VSGLENAGCGLLSSDPDEELNSHLFLSSPPGA
jgi:hypothetical protein